LIRFALDDRFTRMRRERRGKSALITDIPPDERRRDARDLFDPIQGFQIAFAEIVVDDESMALTDDLDAGMRADESSSASDHDGH